MVNVKRELKDKVQTPSSCFIRCVSFQRVKVVGLSLLVIVTLIVFTLISSIYWLDQGMHLLYLYLNKSTFRFDCLELTNVYVCKRVCLNRLNWSKVCRTWYLSNEQIQLIVEKMGILLADDCTIYY